ncbi:MAG: RNA methyltransferase [Gammaproteobacteria bacterium]|nr:RNA methyltransferase [Gammaproteobacteria bacterium]|tara:strand:+ start:5454 stop:6170 length:717 start_codon:yes stop_codon:yes gene_type:complete
MSIIESKIVLVETSHPGNIGAAARAMKTMQLSNLALVNPGDLHDPSARARATRAYDILDQAQIFGSLEDAIADCQHVIGVTARTRANAAKAFTPRVLLENLSEQKEALRVAWVFGRERNGLTNEEIDLCHSVCTIPANPDFSSLNIASAVQIICYEAYCRGLESETSDHQQPTAIAASHELEGFYQHCWQTLEKVEFLDTDNPIPLQRKFRNIFDRTSLTSSEINILRGIFTAILKRF